MSRMCSSSWAMRRGVKARETRVRRMVCDGGSMKMIWPVPLMSWSMSSSTVPWAELNVAGSRWAASTSAKRLRAQKPYCSFQ